MVSEICSRTDPQKARHSIALPRLGRSKHSLCQTADNVFAATHEATVKGRFTVRQLRVRLACWLQQVSSRWLSVRKAAERDTAADISPRIARRRLGCPLRRVVDHVFRDLTVLPVVVANMRLLVLKHQPIGVHDNALARYVMRSVVSVCSSVRLFLYSVF